MQGGRHSLSPPFPHHGPSGTAPSGVTGRPVTYWESQHSPWAPRGLLPGLILSQREQVQVPVSVAPRPHQPLPSSLSCWSPGPIGVPLSGQRHAGVLSLARAGPASSSSPNAVLASHNSPGSHSRRQTFSAKWQDSSLPKEKRV